MGVLVDIFLIFRWGQSTRARNSDGLYVPTFAFQWQIQKLHSCCRFRSQDDVEVAVRRIRECQTRTLFPNDIYEVFGLVALLFVPINRSAGSETLIKADNAFVFQARPANRTQRLSWYCAVISKDTKSNSEGKSLK